MVNHFTNCFDRIRSWSVFLKHRIRNVQCRGWSKRRHANFYFLTVIILSQCSQGSAPILTLISIQCFRCQKNEHWNSIRCQCFSKFQHWIWFNGFNVSMLISMFHFQILSTFSNSRKLYRVSKCLCWKLKHWKPTQCQFLQCFNVNLNVQCWFADPYNAALLKLIGAQRLKDDYSIWF